MIEIQLEIVNAIVHKCLNNESQVSKIRVCTIDAAFSKNIAIIKNLAKIWLYRKPRKWIEKMRPSTKKHERKRQRRLRQPRKYSASSRAITRRCQTWPPSDVTRSESSSMLLLLYGTLPSLLVRKIGIYTCKYIYELCNTRLPWTARTDTRCDEKQQREFHM